MSEIKLAISDDEISACFAVISQLRPHLLEDSFVAQVKEQMQAGFKLACVLDTNVVAVAGFRLAQNLAWGKFLYVDDLITDERVRSKGYGKQLVDWLSCYANEHACQQLHLDSGVQRFAAHKFYLTNNMYISSHHFTLNLS